MFIKIASAFICVAAVMVLIMLSILTPERDKFGNYTNGVRYWCDDAYFQNNFK